MQVRLPKRSFSEALAVLERVVPTRSSSPVLTNLWVEGQEDGLILRGSNGEIDLELAVPAEVDGQGARLVPGQLLGQVVRGLPGELVELALQDGELTIESGSFKTRLATAASDEFPGFEFAVDSLVNIPARELSRAFSRVRYAASGEDYRAIFRGVQLELHPGRLRAVASDGFRLALYDVSLPIEEERKLVVPARSVDEIIRVLERSEGDVSLGAQAGHLTLAGDGFRLVAALMEGEFPDYERVIPQQIALEVRIPAALLRDSLKRVKVLADRSNHRLDLIFNGEALDVVAEGEMGRGSEALQAEVVAGEAMSLAYNAEYLLDALGPLASTARLRFSGAASPSIIQDEDDQGYLAVVVPLRV